MAVIIALSISLLAVAFVAAPFFLFPGRATPKEDDQAPQGLAELLAEKETAYAAIQELEFDRNSGKLSEKDYQAMRERQEAHAAVLLKQIDALEGRGTMTEGTRKPRRDKRKA